MSPVSAGLNQTPACPPVWPVCLPPSRTPATLQVLSPGCEGVGTHGRFSWAPKWAPATRHPITPVAHISAAQGPPRVTPAGGFRGPSRPCPSPGLSPWRIAAAWLSLPALAHSAGLCSFLRSWVKYHFQEEAPSSLEVPGGPPCTRVTFAAPPLPPHFCYCGCRGQGQVCPTSNWMGSLQELC